VGVAEQFADGHAALEQLRNTPTSLRSLVDHACHNASELFTEGEDGIVIADCAAENAAWGATGCKRRPDDQSLGRIFDGHLSCQKRIQANLLRDIIGNPFRPVTLDPSWRTSNVTALAQSIYDDRAFDRLPILADALEDAVAITPTS
jgi:hypothetical protein